MRKNANQDNTITNDHKQCLLAGIDDVICEMTFEVDTFNYGSGSYAHVGFLYRSILVHTNIFFSAFIN